jgi:8-oxo-dGTP diphosphatase
LSIEATAKTFRKYASFPDVTVAPGHRQRKLVVAGLIQKEGRFLLTQRRADQAHPGMWELPGGKIEPGESPQIALSRELWEELSLRVSIQNVWDVLFHAYPEFDVLMLVYSCVPLPGQTPRCTQVQNLAWVDCDGARALDVLPADRPLLLRLEREGLPPGVTGAARGFAPD